MSSAWLVVRPARHIRSLLIRGLNMLSLDRITALVAQTAVELNIPAEVVAATPGGDDRSYVEVIMTIASCREEPCRLMVGLHREQSIDQLRRAIEAALPIIRRFTTRPCRVAAVPVRTGCFLNKLAPATATTQPLRPPWITDTRPSDRPR